MGATCFFKHIYKMIQDETSYVFIYIYVYYIPYPTCLLYSFYLNQYPIKSTIVHRHEARMTKKIVAGKS